jgi:hypothetical protein
MKKWMVFICMLVFMALMTLTASSVFAGESIVDKEFCWKDSYGRGAGKVPQACAEGRDRIGLLCYTKCPAGMKRVGFDCHSVCPDGMRDDGLFCRLAEYGRGAGYPWKAKDGVIHPNDGMRSRCEADHGKGNCEKNGAIYYPKCKPNYHNVGCCICRPDDKPNCEKLGLKKGIDLSCAKKIIIGDPRVGVCPEGQDRDGGLCYKQCKAGYHGVGPVCWGEPPEQDGKKWVNCGMGAARTKLICANTIFNQVSSVGMMAVNLVAEVVTFGGSGAASTAANAAENASKLATLKKKLEELKKLYDAAKPAIQAVIKAKKEVGVIVSEADLANDTVIVPEDIARIAAQIAAIVDPTGIADTVAAYMYPKCSKYFPPKK